MDVKNAAFLHIDSVGTVAELDVRSYLPQHNLSLTEEPTYEKGAALLD